MAKQNAAKGAKKGRRFGRPRSEAAKRRCADRKARRIEIQKQSEMVNKKIREFGGMTPWEVSKAARRIKRHGE
jgi:hypothetical protein